MLLGFHSKRLVIQKGQVECYSVFILRGLLYKRPGKVLLGFHSKKLKNMSLGVDQQLRVVIQKSQVKCYLSTSSGGK